MQTNFRDSDDVVDRLAAIAASLAYEQARRLVIAALSDQASLIADALRDGFAGQRIPKGTSTQRAHRNERIAADHAAGQSITVLARRYCLSRPAIRRILKKAEHAHSI